MSFHRPPLVNFVYYIFFIFIALEMRRNMNK